MALPRVAAAAAAPFTAAGRAAGSAASNTARAALAAAAGPELLAIRTSLTSTVQGIVRSVRGEYSRLAAANDASSDSLDDIKENTSGFSTSIDSLIDVVRNEVVPPLNTMGGYFQDLAEKLSRQRALAGLTEPTPASSDDTPGTVDAKPGTSFGKKIFGFLGGLANGLFDLFKKFWLPLGLAGLLLLAKNAFLEGNSEFAKRIKNAIDLSIVGGLAGFLVGGIPGMIVGGVLGAALGVLVDSKTIDKFTTIKGITGAISDFLGVTKDNLYRLAGGAAIGAGIGGIAGFLTLGIPGAIVGIILGSALGTLVGYSFLPEGDDKKKITESMASLMGTTADKLREKLGRSATAAGIGSVIGATGGALVGGPVGVIAGGILGAALGALVGYKWDDWFPNADDTSWFSFSDFTATLRGGLLGALGAGSVIAIAAAKGMTIGALGGPVGLLVGFLLGATVGYAVNIIQRSVNETFGSFTGLGEYVVDSISSIFQSISDTLLRFIETTKAQVTSILPEIFGGGVPGLQSDLQESEEAAQNIQDEIKNKRRQLDEMILNAKESGVPLSDRDLIISRILSGDIERLENQLRNNLIQQNAIRDVLQRELLGDEYKGRDMQGELEGRIPGSDQLLDSQDMRNLLRRQSLRLNPGAIGYGNGGQPVIMINNNQSYPQVYQNNSRQSVVNQSSSTFIRRSSVPVAQMI